MASKMNLLRSRARLIGKMAVLQKHTAAYKKEGDRSMYTLAQIRKRKGTARPIPHHAESEPQLDHAFVETDMHTHTCAHTPALMHLAASNRCQRFAMRLWWWSSSTRCGS